MRRVGAEYGLAVADSDEADYFAARARVRRHTLANEGVCINGRSHGQATHGVRCAWCAYVHKNGLVRALFELSLTMRPPGYQVRKSRT